MRFFRSLDAIGRRRFPLRFRELRALGYVCTFFIVIGLAVGALIEFPLVVFAIVLFWMLVKSFWLRRAVGLAGVDQMSGGDFEHQVARLLRRQGYHAEVTTLSGDLGVDVVATRRFERIAIQAKCYRSPVSRTAVSDAVGGMKAYDCNSSMVVTNNYFTKGAQELARINGCRLVDRDEVARWIEGKPRISALQWVLVTALFFTLLSLFLFKNERRGTPQAVSEERTAVPSIPDVGLTVRPEEKSEPVVEVQFQIPKLDDGIPDWNSFTQLLYDHYYGGFSPPALGSWVTLTFNDGSTRDGGLVELSAQEVSISILNGSVGFYRDSLSEKCRVNLFAKDYALHHTRARLGREIERYKQSDEEAAANALRKETRRSEKEEKKGHQHLKGESAVVKCPACGASPKIQDLRPPTEHTCPSCKATFRSEQVVDYE